MACTRQATCLAALLVAACMLAPCAAQSALSVLNPNFKKPTHINNYAEYIRYAGQALGYLPVEPEADAPAPGPGAAMAPNSAPAGAGQPDLQAQAGVPQNPTIDDFVNAYKPLDAAINHAFEARITKTNARATQYELASAAAPLQMLINQEAMDQGAAIQSFAKSLLGGAAGATQSIDAGSANPLTGTATTAPAPVQAAATTSDGATVTASDPNAATAGGAASTAAAANNPMGWLRVPSLLGKK